ncbi:MAG: hypothetical protein K9G64_04615 [Bacteroidia bacterium]|nr:hypothetical protein [Bacteroidia bacterium]
MKQLIDAIKVTLAKEGFEGEKLVNQLKELRKFFIDNLNQPGYVRMIRLAYENIQVNGNYTFEYTEDDGVANLDYLLDLLSDYSNKYNKEELIEYRKMMEGEEWISPDQEWEGEDDYLNEEQEEGPKK